MKRFEEELMKFKPILEVGDIEAQLVTEDMKDIMDLLKERVEVRKGNRLENNEFLNKEL